MNFLCPAEVTLYEVYVGREKVGQTSNLQGFFLTVHLGGVH